MPGKPPGCGSVVRSPRGFNADGPALSRHGRSPSARWAQIRVHARRHMDSARVLMAAIGPDRAIRERHLPHGVDRAADRSQGGRAVIADRADGRRTGVDIDRVRGADAELLLELDAKLFEALVDGSRREKRLPTAFCRSSLEPEDTARQRAVRRKEPQLTSEGRDDDGNAKQSAAPARAPAVSLRFQGPALGDAGRVATPRSVLGDAHCGLDQRPRRDAAKMLPTIEGAPAVCVAPLAPARNSPSPAGINSPLARASSTCVFTSERASVDGAATACA